MIILIDGFWGSGKTVLRSLLDGHSELKVSPSQESIVSSFHRNLKKSKYLKYKDLRVIREYLVNSHYYSLEQESYKGYVDSDITKDKIKFNFSEFENFWTEKLLKCDVWTNTEIINLIHNSIIKFFYNLDNYPSDEKKVFMEDNNFNSHKFFLEEVPNSKLIVVKNSASDILASLVNRKTIKDDYRTDLYNSYNFNNLVRKYFFPIKISENIKITNKLKKDFPNRVYECDFKELIYNTKDEMLKISKFLKIQAEEILFIPSHFGQSIRFKDSDPMLNKEKFTGENTFSKYQNSLIKQFEKKFPTYNYFSITIFDFILVKILYHLKSFLKKIINFNDK
tara:strand:- start:881 stop:1891 length:1011 start_codon:yes stop_codon:yes gene_type:complete